MYRAKNILQLKELFDDGKLTKEEAFSKANQLAHYFQDDYNSFVTIIDKVKIKDTDNLLSGIPYSLKDNFSTSGILTTASSNILKDYVPVYDATVYKKLKTLGASLVGKTVLDELAMGGTGTTGHTGVVRNPYDKKRMMGGSSAGSVASVALGIVPFSIGSDTGDSVRKPASFGGVVGFKPTYGLISRYGLFAFASSLDHVAIVTRNVVDSAIVADGIKGYDPLDMVTFKQEGKLTDSLKKDIKGKKLFYIKELCGKDVFKDTTDSELKEVMNSFHELLDRCREKGFIIEEVSVDKTLLEALYPAYMCISCAEATSNNANLTGIQFGPRGEGNSIDEIIFDARTKGFSELIKRRFVLGSYILQKENQEKLFLNACRIRRLIVDRINELFKEYDGMIAPCSGGVAPYFDSSSEKLSDRYLILENHLVIGNFGGFPSISIPYTKINNLPVDLNITGRVKEDGDVLNMASKIEKLTNLKDIYAEVGDIDV